MGVVEVQRVACAVAQKNLGKQYLVETLETANITPGCVMNNQEKKMDYEAYKTKDHIWYRNKLWWKWKLNLWN